MSEICASCGQLGHMIRGEGGAVWWSHYQPPPEPHVFDLVSTGN